MKDNLIAIAGVALVVLIIVASIWFATSAPCEMYRFAANKDVPARCIGEYTD